MFVRERNRRNFINSEIYYYLRTYRKVSLRSKSVVNYIDYLDIVTHTSIIFINIAFLARNRELRLVFIVEITPPPRFMSNSLTNIDNDILKLID